MDHQSSPLDRLLDAVLPALGRLLDALAAATAVGTVLQMLPSVAALFTIIWTGIRIWETSTVQAWFGRKMDAKDRRKGEPE